MTQASYPPLSESTADNLAEMKKATAKELTRAPSILDFIASRQQGTLGALSEAVIHLLVALIQTYVEEGIPVQTGLP